MPDVSNDEKDQVCGLSPEETNLTQRWTRFPLCIPEASTWRRVTAGPWVLMATRHGSPLPLRGAPAESPTAPAVLLLLPLVSAGL